MDVERVDLAAVAAMLDRELEGRAPEGFVRGRTVLRDAVMAHFSCSALEAEELVDTMVGRGFLRFSGDPAAPAAGGVWRIEHGSR
ncbi:MAG TPA: hypothetical protein VHE30_27385 [Polyangiaceae bacterium]|nr:hypothetical protein [Polyangiaceae bacterium]